MEGIEIRVASVGKLIAALEAAPVGCKRIWISGPIGDAGARVLAKSPKVADAVVLSLYASTIGPAGAAALAASPHLSNVRALALWGGAIGDEGACALAASTTLRGLTSFSYDGGEELALLLDSDPFASLAVLTIGPSREAAIALQSRKRGAPTIGRLAVSYADERNITRGIADEGAVAIAQSPHLAALQVLSIAGGNRVGSRGGAALADACFAASLEELSIEGRGPGRGEPRPEEQVGPMTLVQIAGNPAFARLRSLTLDCAGIGPAAIGALASSTTLDAVENLGLARNRAIDLRSVELLVSSPIADRLKSLDLSWTGAGKEGAWALVQSKRLNRIEKLQYVGNGVEGPREAWYDQGAMIGEPSLGDPAAAALEMRFYGKVAVG